MNWDDITQGEQYQQSDNYQRELMRNDFINSTIGQYGLDENQANEFRTEFDRLTAPRGNVMSGELNDGWKSFASGAVSATADMAQGLTLGEPNAVSKSLRGYGNELSEDRSPSTIEAVENFGFGEDRELSGRGFVYGTIGGLGSMAPMIAGGGVTGYAAKGLGRAAQGYTKAKKTLDAADNAADAATAGARVAQIENRADKAGAAIGFGGVGAAMVGGGAGEQTFQEVLALDDQSLLDSDAFQHYYRQEYQVSPENRRAAFDAAKERLAGDLANGSFYKAAAAGGLSMAVLGPVLQKIVMGRGAQGALKNSGAGAGTEAIQETIETGGQQLATNAALTTLDGRSVWHDVPEQAATGALLGGTTGGAAGIPGGFLNRGHTQATQEDIANGIVDNQRQIALAEEQLSGLDENIRFLEQQVQTPDGNQQELHDQLNTLKAQRSQAVQDIRDISLQNAEQELQMRSARSQAQTRTDNPLSNDQNSQAGTETIPGDWNQWQQPESKPQSERFSRPQENPFNEVGEQRVGRDDGKPFSSLDEAYQHVGRYDLNQYPFHVQKVNDGYILVGMPDAKAQEAINNGSMKSFDGAEALEGEYFSLDDYHAWRMREQASQPTLQDQSNTQPQPATDLFPTEQAAWQFMQKSGVKGTPIDLGNGYWRINSNSESLTDERRTFVDAQGNAGSSLKDIDGLNRHQREDRARERHPGHPYTGNDSDYQTYSGKAAQLNKLLRTFKGDPRNRSAFNELKQAIKDTKRLEKSAMEQARQMRKAGKSASIEPVNLVEVLQQARTALESSRIDEFNSLMDEIRQTNQEEQARLAGKPSANTAPFSDSRLQNQQYRDYLDLVAQEAKQNQAKQEAKEAAKSSKVLDDDSLLMAVRKLGGIKTDSIEDTVAESIKSWAKTQQKSIGSRYVNNGKKARSLDDMGRILSGFGYMDSNGQELGANTLTDAIMDEMAGRPHFSQAMSDYGELYQQAGSYAAASATNVTEPAIRAVLSGESLSPAYQKEVIRVLDEAEHDPIFEKPRFLNEEQADIEQQRQDNAVDESWYERYELKALGYAEANTGLDSDQFTDVDWKALSKRMELLDAAKHEQNNQVEEDDGSEQTNANGRADPRIRYGAEGVGKENGQERSESEQQSRTNQQSEEEAEVTPPELELTTQTEEELEQKTQTRKASEEQQRKADLEVEQKAQADKEADDFSLKGSDSVSDSNPDQTDLLSDAQKPDTKIEDFGEKIGGARKDAWSGFRESLEAEIDIAASPLSRAFPAPDYEKLHEAGVDPQALAIIAAIRADIPSKPRRAYKLKSWVGNVEAARQIASMLVEGKVSTDKVIEAMQSDNNAPQGILSILPVLAKLSPANMKAAAGYRIRSGSFGIFNGERFDKPKSLFYLVDSKTRRTNYDISGESLKDVQEQAEQFINNQLKEKPASKGRQTTFDVFSTRGEKGYWIGKKVATGKYIHLKEGFETATEARTYRDENQTDLEELLKQRKYVAAHRRSENKERSGKDRRGGKSIIPEAFGKTFGFRGVEFGNWVNQNKRQSDLDQAYDALQDLASVTGIPVEAVSLNGELGLAFGARGRGGKNPAAAHYEPGKVAINLTKKNGSGSLAHEWWHALDNYFSRFRKTPDEYLSENPKKGVYKKGEFQREGSVRPEVEEAFEAVVKAIESTGLVERSRGLDSTRTKDYWSTIREMTARTFENHVIEKLKAADIQNDYLANVVTEADFGGSNNQYPYLTEIEIETVSQAFDKLFKTLKHRKTDKGIQLYRLGEGKGISQKEAARTATQLRNRLGVTVEAVATESELPTHIRKQIDKDQVNGQVKGLFDPETGKAYIVADNLDSRTDAIKAVLHELVGHKGVRQVLGNKLNLTLEQLYRSMPADTRKALEEKYSKQLEGMEAKDQRRTVAEEYLAHLAETDPKNSLLKTAISKARNWLRSLFPSIKWTEADAVELLQAAKRTLKDGDPDGGRKTESYTPTSNIDQMDVLQVDPSQLIRKGRMSFLRQKIMEQAEQLDGKSVVNEATGENIWFYKKGFKHSSSGPLDRNEELAVRLMPLMPEIVKRAVPYEQAPDKKGRRSISGATKLRSKIQIGEKEYFVDLRVRGHSNDEMQRLYDHRVRKKDPAGIDGEHPHNLVIADVSLHPTTGSNTSIDQRKAEKFDDSKGEKGLRYSLAASETMSAMPDDIMDDIKRTNAGTYQQQGIVERVSGWFKELDLLAKATWKDVGQRAYTGAIDQFDPIARMEKGANEGKLKEAKDSAYKAALRTKNLDGIMTAVLGKGTPTLQEGSVTMRQGSKGLLEIFEPLAKDGKLEIWEHWAAAKRAQRLLREGKENLFDQPTIDRINRYVDARPDLKKQFQQIHKEYQAFNNQILDFAEQSGLIDQDSRKLWEKDDYLPFHRVNRLDDDKQSGLFRRKGLSNQQNGIKKLEGGVEQISPMEAIYRNTASLMDASFKNIAMQRIAEIGESAGVMEKAQGADRLTTDQVKERLIELGITSEGETLSVEQVKRWKNMLLKFEELGDGAVKVSRDGKTEVYQVHDQALFETMSAMGPDTLNGILKVFAMPKRLLTSMVTADPAFMARNFVRDTLSTWMTVHPDINGQTLHASMAGAMKNVAKGLESDEHWQLMMAGGGGGGFYQINPENVRNKLTPGKYKSHHRRVSDNMTQAWQFWQKQGSRFENANRLAVFRDAIDKGASIAEAAHQAQDVLNFTKRGKWQTTRILTEIIPFLNARVQGLDRLARGGIENPSAMMLRGAIYTAASLALLSLFADDERYIELPEHEKLTYHHFWDDEDNHWRIPKPFEMGAIFGTVPEIAYNTLIGDEESKWAAKMAGGILTGVFAFGMPQFIKPAYEVATNENRFTGAPILSLGMQYRRPEAQYTPWTSETMKALAESVPEAAPDWMRSPKRLEHLMRGYFGSLGGYMMMAADGLSREVRDAPERPRDWKHVPVVGSFFRGSSEGATRYSSEMYDMMREANTLASTIKGYQEQGFDDKAKELEQNNRQALAGRKQLNRYSRSISKLRKEVKKILDNRLMTSSTKRQKIDRLNRQINELYREAIEKRGG